MTTPPSPARNVDRWTPLLDPPAFPPDRYALIADRIKALLTTENDVLLIQAEAVVALEAVATSIARPGLKALNIVTSPYGGWFGKWLARGGADVVTLAAEPARAVTIDAVRQALDAAPDSAVLALVHAESASGICNPLDEIAELARSRGIVTVVDAVASIGGHPLDIDALGIDIAVIGPQKALAGPAGLSALSISPAAWKLVSEENSPRDSILSLLDQRAWIESGRAALPGTTAPLEFFALEAALDRIEAEAVAATVARHAKASHATRAGLKALGAMLWASDRTTSRLVTTVEAPATSTPSEIIAAASDLGCELTSGVGPGAERLVRFNHTGNRARFETVLSAVTAYGIALQRLGLKADIGSAAAAIAAVYAD
jgi:aspartate aminotransferase-like enzyme